MEDFAINDDTEVSSLADKFFHPLTDVCEKECLDNSMDMGEGTACSGTLRQTFQQTSELARLFLRRKIMEWSIAKYEAEMTLSKEEYKEFMLDLLAEKAHIANYLCNAYGMDPKRFWWNDPNYEENRNLAQGGAEQCRDCHERQLDLDAVTEDSKVNTTKSETTGDSNIKMSEIDGDRDTGSQNYFFLTKLIQFFMYLRKYD